jgi:hypothetical protein
MASMKQAVRMVLVAAPLLLGAEWPVSKTPTVPVPMDNVTVFAFSQSNPGDSDPQVLQLAPDIVIRGWGRWDRGGTQASDYDAAWLKTVQAAGVRFVGGTTATVLFRDEAASDAQFRDWATRDAAGNLVPHDEIVPGAYRGSLANPRYREYLVGIGKTQIDVGVDGVFYDELSGDYQGANYDGDEGFDNYHIADFSAFLLSHFPPGTDLGAKLGGGPDDRRPGRPQPEFNYRNYLAQHGWSLTPFAPDNPLAAQWGRVVGNHPVPGATDFVNQAEPYLYWKQIVSELRAYAQQKYGRTLLMTSNGIWPFADFQGVGLYDYNNDGPGGTDVDFCPLTVNGHLDGTRSFQAAFVNLRNISAQFAPGAPVALFIDWPTPLMDRYNALPPTERQDYWRLYAAEAYANGVFFCFHLKTTTGEPTATQAGVMPLFQNLAAFYRAHAGFYHGVLPSTANATVSVPGAMIAVTDQAQPNRRLVHIVNHQYNAGFIAQSNVTVTVDAAAAPASVTLSSPDLAQDEDVPFAWSGGKLTMTLPRLLAYDIVAMSW